MVGRLGRRETGSVRFVGMIVRGASRRPLRRVIVGLSCILAAVILGLAGAGAQQPQRAENLTIATEADKGNLTPYSFRPPRRASTARWWASSTTRSSCTPTPRSRSRRPALVAYHFATVAQKAGLESEARLAGDAVEILKDGGVPDPGYNKRPIDYMNEAVESGLFVSV